MDVAVTIAVGFGSAVLGAVAGFLGAVSIDWNQLHRKRVGVVRSILGELRVNFSSAVLQLHYGKRLAGYGAETWRAANFELAQFVGDPLYRKLLHIYWMMPAMEAISQQFDRETMEQPIRETLEKWLQSISETMDELLKLPEAAKFRKDWRSLPSLEEAAILTREAAKGDDRQQSGE